MILKMLAIFLGGCLWAGFDYYTKLGKWIILPIATTLILGGFFL